MIFLFQRRLMSFAWKRFLTMLFGLFAPGIQGTLGNAQFSGDVRFRFAAVQSKSYSFLLPLDGKGRCGFGMIFSLFQERCLPTYYHSTKLGEVQHCLAKSGGGDEAANRTLLHPDCHERLHHQGLSVTKPLPSREV